jgi:exonuclease SbcC
MRRLSVRPIKLELEGFTSFRQRIAIDFSDLDLFAITGPTGSGKTSIIDAITYALYGRTPRMGAKNLTELITQGLSRMSVLFEFQSNRKQYRVVRTVKRSGPSQTRFEVIESGNTRPIEGGVSEIPKIVGLDFEGFTKAVLLPQGQFDQFLRGKVDDRRSILESLLNVGVYRDMMQIANARGKAFQAEAEILKSQLEREYANSTQAHRSELVAEIERLSGEAQSADSNLKHVEKTWAPALQVRHVRDSRAKAELERDGAERDITKERKKEVALVTRVKDHQEEVKRLQGQLAGVSYDEVLHNKLTGLLPLARQLATLERNNGAWARDRTAKSGDLQELEAQLSSTKEALKKRTHDRVAAEQAYRQAKDRLAGLTKKHGTPDVIENASADLDQLTALEQQLEQDRKDLAHLEERGKTLSAKIRDLEREEMQAKKEHADSREAVEALILKHSAEELRSHIKVGDPCPVCDQVVGRLPKRPTTSLLDKARVREVGCEKEWHRISEVVARTTADLDAIPAQIKGAKQSIGRISKQADDLRAKAERILGKKPTEATIRHQLERVAAEVRAAAVECTSKESANTSAIKAENEAKEVLNETDRRRDRLAQQVAGLSDQIARASLEITRLKSELANTGDAKAIEAGLRQQEEAKKKRAKALAEIEHARSLQKEAEDDQTAVATRIAGLSGQLETCRKTIERSNSDLLRLEAQLKQALRGWELPEGRDEAERIEKLLKRLRSDAANCHDRLRETRSSLELLEARIAEATKKRERMAEVDASAQIFLQLGVLLRADQFTRFVLEDAFTLLCYEGTRQLSVLSQGRYSFSTERDEFQVIDHWNADERRSVRTLSGGESFLASLALALALAASVSQLSEAGGCGRLDSLFLDEGFSTLDADALNVAVEALQTVQEGDRMVAVVSHLTDLAERLPGRLQVVKGLSGSTVIMEQSRTQVAAG